MTISKQALNYYGVTENEYIEWAKNNSKPAYKTETKKEFFEKLKSRELYRNVIGVLVEKQK